MKHHWARWKRRRQYLGGRWLAPEDQVYPRLRLGHCINCGAVSWSRRSYKNGKVTYRVYYTPYGGLTRVVVKVPPCEGLPENYEPPMG